MQRRGTQLRETFPSEPEASTHHVGAVLGHLHDAPKPGTGVGLAGIADLTELTRLQSGTCKQVSDFVGATEGGVCNTSRAYLERLLLLPKFNRQRFNGGHVVDMDILSTGAWPGSYKLWKAIGRQGLKLTSSSPLSYWTFILFLVLEMTCIQYGIRYRYVALCR